MHGEEFTKVHPLSGPERLNIFCNWANIVESINTNIHHGMRKYHVALECNEALHTAHEGKEGPDQAVMTRLGLQLEDSWDWDESESPASEASKGFIYVHQQ